MYGMKGRRKSVENLKFSETNLLIMEIISSDWLIHIIICAGLKHQQPFRITYHMWSDQSTGLNALLRIVWNFIRPFLWFINKVENFIKCCNFFLCFRLKQVMWLSKLMEQMFIVLPRKKVFHVLFLRRSLAKIDWVSNLPKPAFKQFSYYMFFLFFEFWFPFFFLIHNLLYILFYSFQTKSFIHLLYSFNFSIFFAVVSVLKCLRLSQDPVTLELKRGNYCVFASFLNGFSFYTKHYFSLSDILNEWLLCKKMYVKWVLYKIIN